MGYDVQLRHHGDSELAPGLIDLAVNVRSGDRPAWLTEPITAALARLDRYPDQTAARAAVAARHRRPEAEVLLTSGAAEAFVLLARALRPQRSVVVHPQFTEPEAALLAAGHPVHRVILAESGGFVLDPALVPDDADLVVVGNPTNPTSVGHPTDAVAALAREGRVLVVDEAFTDTVHAAGRPEPLSLSARRDLPGLVVVRSLTKTWGLAGLRVGYLLAPAELVGVLAEAQPLWPVSAPALAAATACASPRAAAEEVRLAAELAADRSYLVDALRRVPGVRVLGEPVASFVLLRVDGGGAVRLALRDRGWAVRRGDTFPGLGADHLRVAVRDPDTTDAFVSALCDLG
jgi:histidinol-phosphate aminotransferase